MQILLCSHHLQLGLLQQVQRRWNILSLLVAVVVDSTLVVAAVRVDLEQVQVIQ